MFAKLVVFIIEKFVIKLAARTKTELDELVLKTIKWPLYYAIILFGTYFAVKTTFPTFYPDYVHKIFSIAEILLGIWIVIRISDVVIRNYLAQIATRIEARLDEELVRLLQRIAKVFIWIIGAIIIIKALGYEISPLVASLGIAGLAIALALQDTLANFFAGVYISVDKPFKIGDNIQLASGEAGDVVDIGLRTTKIKTPDNATLIVPNSEITKTRVLNLSQPSESIRVVVPIGVAYGTDLNKVKKILTEIAVNAPYALKDPQPLVLFKSFGDFSLNLELIFWIENLRKKMIVIDHINSQINERFKKEGIEIPFPVRTLIMKKET